MVTHEIQSRTMEQTEYRRRQSVDGSDPAYNVSAKESLRAGERTLHPPLNLNSPARNRVDDRLRR